jgi:secreted trypsin-like serine protease
MVFQGDSGSPIQVTSKNNRCLFYIMGITSFGKKCGDEGLPAVYTRVSHYLDWIEGIVWPGET